MLLVGENWGVFLAYLKPESLSFSVCRLSNAFRYPLASVMPVGQSKDRETRSGLQNLESRKSITSRSSNERQGTVRLKSQAGSPLTGSITKGKGNHTAYLIHQKRPFEMCCWVASSLANAAGIDGVAPGREDAWPKRDGPGHVSMGTGPSAGSS